jgi:phage gp16-like protein
MTDMAQSKKPIAPKKKALLAKIHIAKKDLGLDDGTYRDVLRRITGKDSSSKMLISELERVIYEFGNLGWKPSAAAKSKHGKKPKVSTDKPNRQAVMDKIEAILTDMGLHWNYAHGIARGMHKKEKLDFCTDEELHKVMQGLAVYQNRQRKKAKQEGNE